MYFDLVKVVNENIELYNELDKGVRTDATKKIDISITNDVSDLSKQLIGKMGELKKQQVELKENLGKINTASIKSGENVSAPVKNLASSINFEKK